MLPGATKYTNKLDQRILQSKIKRVFWGRNEGLKGKQKDGSRLEFIKFDFVTGNQDIKNVILVKFCPNLLVIMLFFSPDISLLSSLLAFSLR